MASKAKGVIDIEVKGDRFKATITDFVSSLSKLEAAGKQSGTSLKSLGSSAQGAVARMNTLHSVTSRASAALFKNTQGMANLGQATVQMAQKSQGAVLPMDKLNTAINNTNRSAIQLGNQGAQGVNKFTGAAQRAGAGAGQMSQGVNQATQATSRFNAGTIGTAASIGTMGAGLVSLEASMSNYTKAAYKVEKATVGVEKAKLGEQKANTMLLNAQNMLDNARKRGNKTAEEMQYYEEQVINYREDLSLKTEDLKLKQEKLNIANMDYADTQKLMASSIATTLLGTISAAASMIQAKSMSTIKDTAAMAGNTAGSKANALANIANSRALKILGIDLNLAKTHFSTASASMKSFGFSAQGARAGLSGLASGFKGLYAAMGPVGLAILAATTIWQLWETNALGFRDAVHWVIDELQKLMGALNQVLPIFGWIDDGLKSIGINVGENIDQWQEMDKTIYQTDQTLQGADTTVSQATATLESFEVQTLDSGQAVDTLTQEVSEAIIATEAHTSALSVDMQMLRSHAQAARDNSSAMLDSHITSFDNAADAILTHDERLRVNLAGLQNWAKNYKEKLAESEENGAKFVNTTEAEFSRLVSSLKADGHDVDSTLRLMGVTSIDTSQVIQESMAGAGQSMHGFAADTEAAGVRVQSTMKTLHNEIAAFEAALKKNDNFVEWTISDILRGFQVMSKEAQAEYEKIMILKAQAITGGNTSIDSLEDALTVTEQARTGNWNNPTHAEGIGANMQHHGPTQVDTEANKLLREGIYVPAEYLTGGMWKKSHSDSYKLGKKYHSKTGKPKAVATWNGRSFVIHKPGSPEYVKLFGISGFTTKYTTGGPSSRSVALETSLGHDIEAIKEQIENKDNADADPQDQRQTIEVFQK